MVELRYYERICRLMMMIGLRLPALYQSLPQTSQSAIGPSSPLAARPTDSSGPVELGGGSDFGLSF